ncbi:hypothetical protein BC936DRAFT_149452 [Jimgerdemannia flammicorona]|uniref:GDP-fucose protein O-fucosyltransferase 2 n=1 Tax=Jimgerdemannia flammicorona TaxID=994334 RepID=A0A433D0T0_9FUNG|nr:hypothetical protein BC936DRAFT_149452 [Jimgerdemannia flammicorona]
MAHCTPFVCPSRRHILTGLLVTTIFLLTFIGLRVSLDDTYLQETGATRPQEAAGTLGSQGPADVPVATYDERFLTLDFTLTLGLNNLSYQPSLCAIEGHRINDWSNGNVTRNSWAMPITNFFDLAHLRKYVKVITVSEFLQFQLDRNPTIRGIPAALASYQVLDDLASQGQSLARYAPDLTSETVNMYNYLHEQPNGVLNIDDTAPIVDLFRSSLPHPDASPEDVERDLLELDDIIEAPIWGYVDLPDMAIDQEYNMTIRVLPPREWTVRATNGWVEPDEVSVDADCESRDAFYLHYSSPIAVTGLRQRFNTPDLHNIQILHLSGYPHRFAHHPIKFSTLEGRKLYDNVVMDWLRYAKPVWNTYEYIKGKMDWKTAGRPYLAILATKRKIYRKSGNYKIINENPYSAFHIRRTDFSQYNWIGPTTDPNNLIATYQSTVADLNLKYKTMVLDKWDAARQDAAHRLAEWESAASLAQNNTQPGDPLIPTSSRPPAFDIPSPLPLSPYTFISTDEADPDVIARLKALNGITLFDLFIHERNGDKESFYDGNYQLTVFGDLLGMVDQLICRDGWSFVGTRRSSFTGGIFNLRKGLGLDDGLTCYFSDYK